MLRGRPQAVTNGVLVVGMHRTGTSAIGAVLSAIGFASGRLSDPLATLPENPRGFFELQGVAEFDDRMLDALGWAWDAPPAAPPDDFPALDDLVAEGRDLAGQAFLGNDRWFLKDPRMALLMHWWRRILLDRFVVVVPYRPAAEVAWSLHLRNGFSVELGLSLWAAYHRHMARGLAGLPVAIVNYVAVAERPRDVVPEFLGALERLGAVSEPDQNAAIATIEGELRRATSPHDPPVGHESAAVNQLEISWATDSVSVLERFDLAVSDPSPWEVSLLDAHRDLVQTERHHDAVRQQLDDGQRRAADEHRQELQRVADEHRQELQGVADEHRQELQGVADERDRVAKELALLEQRLVTTDDALADVRGEADRYRAELARALIETYATNSGPMGSLLGWWARSERSHPRPFAVVAWPFRFLWRALVLFRLRSFGVNPLFDADWYVEEYPETAAEPSPWRHYRTIGAERGYWPNPFFDPAWYRQRYPDVALGGIDPLHHYYRWGAAEGRDPSPAFSTSGYLVANPDVVNSGMNPLEHYLLHGIREGRPPCDLWQDGAADLTPPERYGELYEPALAARTERVDVLWFGVIDWEFRIQRPQHLASPWHRRAIASSTSSRTSTRAMAAGPSRSCRTRTPVSSRSD